MKASGSADAVPSPTALRRTDVYSTVAGSAIVLFVALAYAVGLPWLETVITGSRDVRSGSRLEVDRGVSFISRGGWDVEKKPTDVIPAYVLSRQGATFSVTVTSYDRAVDKGWFEEHGGDESGRVQYGDVIPFETTSGLKGETYSYHEELEKGRVWVIGLEEEDVAILAQVRGAHADFDEAFPDAQRMAHSISHSTEQP